MPRTAGTLLIMIKALLKARLKSRQVNANFHGQFGHGIKSSAIPRHCGDSAGQNTAVKPGYAPANIAPGPEGMGFPVTGA